MCGKKFSSVAHHNTKSEKIFNNNCVTLIKSAKWTIWDFSPVGTLIFEKQVNMTTRS